MAGSATIAERLRQASARAFELQDPAVGALITVDVLVYPPIVGVRVRREHKVEYRSISLAALERAEANPLLGLIDQCVAAVGKS